MRVVVFPAVGMCEKANKIKVDPTTDPWDTTFVNIVPLEMAPATVTTCFLSFKKF